MTKKLRQFDDFEIECGTRGVILTIFPVENNSKVKTSFDVQRVVVKYMKTKGWEYV